MPFKSRRTNGNASKASKPKKSAQQGARENIERATAKLEEAIRTGAGRPPAWETPEAMEKAIQEFFDICDGKIGQDDIPPEKRHRRPYTLSGLAVHLDVTRQLISRYNKKDGFCDILRRARAKCEAWLVENAIMENSSSNFTAFVLKNGHNFEEKQKLEVESASAAAKDLNADQAFDVLQQYGIGK